MIPTRGDCLSFLIPPWCGLLLNPFQWETRQFVLCFATQNPSQKRSVFRVLASFFNYYRPAKGKTCLKSLYHQITGVGLQVQSPADDLWWVSSTGQEKIRLNSSFKSPGNRLWLIYTLLLPDTHCLLFHSLSYSLSLSKTSFHIAVTIIFHLNLNTEHLLLSFSSLQQIRCPARCP